MEQGVQLRESVLFRYNVNPDGIPISIKIDNENKQISPLYNTIQLEQIPDETQEIVLLKNGTTRMTQVYNEDEISDTTFYVDYTKGLAKFTKANAGKTTVINYYGKGIELISASRVYDEYTYTGEGLIKTIQEIIDEGRKAIELIKTLGDAVIIINKLQENINTGSVLHDNLVNDISIATPLQQDLHSDIQTANTFKDQLHQDVIDGKVLSPILKQDVIDGRNTKADLDKARADASVDIAKINATGNKSLVIGASSFINNQYTWTHNINSDNLIVVFIDSVTNEPLMLDYKIIDKNNILIRNSAEHPNIKVILSASFYNGNTAIGTTMEEFNGDTFTEGMKQVRLKDNQTNTYQMPITNSDAVYMSDGSTRLTKKITNIETDLANKAPKTDLDLKANDTDNTRTTTDKTVTGAINELNASISGINTSVGGINTSIGEINTKLNGKQNSSDTTLTTTSKTISGAINELATKSNAIESKLPLATSYVPTLGAGLSAYDDTVVNLMTVSKEGFVTYNFCVTGGKSNNNISNGATLCYIPAGVPVSKISYDVVNIETSSGLRRLAMAIVKPSDRSIVLYFIGEETAVSSAKGTVKWYVATP